MKINIVWLRRDLRLDDNKALIAASKQSLPILLLFIFDQSILSELSKDDSRVTFIHQLLNDLNKKLSSFNSSILIEHGNIQGVWNKLTENLEINSVFYNRDYEPYAVSRDSEITAMLESKNISVNSFKDHVIFEPIEVLKDDNTPYTVYTPYKKRWLQKFQSTNILIEEIPPGIQFLMHQNSFPKLSEIGFIKSQIKPSPIQFDQLADYEKTRDYPAKNTTSRLGPYLRFGAVSIRKMVLYAQNTNQTFLSELIWREFFIQILSHFPKVVHQNFKRKYDAVEWTNSQDLFEKWCAGQTGYPLVDAGMRELNATGYMHNRVRMVVASFLTKHLLIDWKWGEAYFAKHLLDYELASNNGNWQWAAGTGCDAAPYFRIFNPQTQLTKFDRNLDYVNKWLSTRDLDNYIPKIVDHKTARIKALNAYKSALEKET